MHVAHVSADQRICSCVTGAEAASCTPIGGGNDDDDGFDDMLIDSLRPADPPRDEFFVPLDSSAQLAQSLKRPDFQVTSSKLVSTIRS